MIVIIVTTVLFFIVTSKDFQLLRMALNMKAKSLNNNNNNNNRIERRYLRFFYNLLTVPWAVSNTYAQVARAQLCANHVQHIERISRASVMLRATWYEGTAQLLSLTELKSHLFELYFIGWIIKPVKVSFVVLWLSSLS